MYVLDPQMGGRRRALGRDKLIETATRVRKTAGRTARDLSNRSTGILSEVRSRFSDGETDDEVLEGRVRSKLGFLVRHPAAVITQVSNGRVVLRGPVLADEVQQLISGIRAVRGVTDVESRLDIHDQAAQGDKPRPSGEVWDVMQRHWSPSTRFLVGTAGALSLGLLAYSLSDESRRSRVLRPKRTKEQPEQEETKAGWAS